MTGDGDAPGVEAADRSKSAAGGVMELHLDEMFDQLAGTGSTGRRALAEAEDHLREAVADEMARGVPADQAERNAVRRFGPPRRIAGQFRRVHRGAAPISGAWLLAGIAVLTLAADRLFKALDVAIQMRAGRAGSCVEQLTAAATATGAAVPCEIATAAWHYNAKMGLLLSLLGAAMLASRWAAVRYAGLARTSHHASRWVAAMFMVAGVLLFALNPATPYGQHLFGAYGGTSLGWFGRWHQVIESGLALLISLAVIGRHAARTRRLRGRTDA